MKKEIASSQGRFTPAELRANVRESKAYWSSPEGQAEKRRQDEKQRNRRNAPPRFPELAAKSSMKPQFANLHRKLDLIDR